jgi:hypothetical protein
MKLRAERRIWSFPRTRAAPRALVAITMGIFGGLPNKLLGMHAGVQFMAYYTAVLFVPRVLQLTG